MRMIDLKKLEKKLDDALHLTTERTFNKWIMDKHYQEFFKYRIDSFGCRKLAYTDLIYNYISKVRIKKLIKFSVLHGGDNEIIFYFKRKAGELYIIIDTSIYLAFYFEGRKSYIAKSLKQNFNSDIDQFLMDVKKFLTIE